MAVASDNLFALELTNARAPPNSCLRLSSRYFGLGYQKSIPDDLRKFYLRVTVANRIVPNSSMLTQWSPSCFFRGASDEESSRDS